MWRSGDLGMQRCELWQEHVWWSKRHTVLWLKANYAKMNTTNGEKKNSLNKINKNVLGITQHIERAKYTDYEFTYLNWRREKEFQNFLCSLSAKWMECSTRREKISRQKNEPLNNTNTTHNINNNINEHIVRATGDKQFETNIKEYVILCEFCH